MPAYAPGTPSWTDLSSPDAEGSAAFYREVMGWTATEPSHAQETGGYRMFQQDGKNVAGLMPHMEEGQPTVWSTYISVADADDTVRKARDAGGTIMVEPIDVMDLGRMAFLVDPAGAVLGIWQPTGFAGADLINEPGSLCWNELLTRDVEAGRAFYPAVFGWTAARPEMPDAPETYTLWEIDGKPIGGMMQMTDDYFPPEIPPHWGVCFAVADCDATVEKAREQGGTITYEPMDMSIGRFAGIVDPQGASFTVMKLAPTS
jgi:predicted enzyme related to lactoylglutathione lyase